MELPSYSPQGAKVAPTQTPSILVVPTDTVSDDKVEELYDFSPSHPTHSPSEHSAHTRSFGLSASKKWGSMFKRNMSKLFSDSKTSIEIRNEELTDKEVLSILQESDSGLQRSPLEVRIEISVQDETDEFHMEVCKRSSEKNINRTDAIIDVYTDRYIAASGSINSALIDILNSSFSEDTINLFAKSLLAKGASPFTCDPDLNTPLHLVAKKGFMSIAKKLVEVMAMVYSRNKDGDTPFELAVSNRHDSIAAYLAAAMPDYEVRRLFTASGDKWSRISFHNMLEKAEEFRETILAVLDAMKVLDQQTDSTYHLYYGILEADSKGFQPRQHNFNKHEKSCLHIVSRSGYEEIVYHDTVRLLLRYKWKKFGRVRFLLQCLSYLLHILVMSLAFILAAREDNPKHYFYPQVTASNVIRLLCEIAYIFFTFWNLASEVFQMFRHRLRYLLDWYNYLDLGALLCSLLIIPLRFSQNPQAENAQWFFASIAYLLNVMRGYKFAVVLRTTGAYVEIIGSILRYDIVPFSIIFMMFLFGFSGATYLALKFEGVVDAARSAYVSCPYGNSTNSLKPTRCQEQTYQVGEWWFVLFNGLRVMVESGPVFENYYQPCSTCGFGWLSLFLHVIFLFFVIVVFLNLIIAQMSDTYQNVWSDAQRKLYKNRAWILARIEHNSLLAICLRDYRAKHFRPLEVIKNPKTILDKWEAPPLNTLGKNVEKLQAEAASQLSVLEEIKAMLADHERLMMQVLRNQASQMDNVEIPRLKQRSRVINQITEANKVSEGIIQIRSFLQLH